MCARVGRLPSNEAHLEGPPGFESCCPEKRERLLALCSNYRLFLQSSVYHLMSAFFESVVDPHRHQRCQLQMAEMSTRLIGGLTGLVVTLDFYLVSAPS